LALPYGFLLILLSNPGLSSFRLLPLNSQVVGRYYILEPQLDGQKLGRQSSKAFSITSKAAAAKADSGRKWKLVIRVIRWLPRRPASCRVERSRKDGIRRDCMMTTNVAAFRSCATRSLLHIETWDNKTSEHLLTMSILQLRYVKPSKIARARNAEIQRKCIDKITYFDSSKNRSEVEELVVGSTGVIKHVE